MSAKRILLIESGHFIGGVIQHLFAQQAELSVTEVFPSSAEELMDAVDKHRPDVVVLDDTLEPEYLSQLLGTNHDCSNMAVVLVYTNSNRVSLYRKQQINVKHTEDLFSVL